MPNFKFIARNDKGRSVSGHRNATSAEGLAELLIRDGLIPIEIVQDAPASFGAKKKEGLSFNLSLTKPHVSEEELYLFCRQMYTLIRAGIPLASAVGRLAETTRDKLLSKTLMAILQDLNKGHALYSCLKLHPDVFGEFFVNLVQVGENTGRLDEIFSHLAGYLELEIDTKKKLKTATRYPIMVLVASIVALLIINAFVVPSFAALFKNFKGTLPFTTQLLMMSSNLLIHYWPFMLVSVLLSLYAARAYLKTEKGRFKASKWLLNIPIIGSLIHRILIARFARVYALVLRSGIPAIDGLVLVGGATGHVMMAQKLKAAAETIARGNSISTALSQTGLFPPLLTQMVSLGEESGNIDSLLDEAADFYQREVNYELTRLSDAIEPILLFMMAGIVLVLALGVFLPMWDMASQMQRR